MRVSREGKAQTVIKVLDEDEDEEESHYSLIRQPDGHEAQSPKRYQLISTCLNYLCSFGGLTTDVLRSINVHEETRWRKIINTVLVRALVSPPSGPAAVGHVEHTFSNPLGH